MNLHRIKRRGNTKEAGFALVTAVVILVLVSSVVVNLIDYSSQEMQAGGRARTTSKNFYSADSGIQLALQRIQPTRDLNPFTYNLSDGTLVESRTRDDATPQSIDQLEPGPPPDGYSREEKSGFVNEIFLVNVIAQGTNSGIAELEAKLGSLQPKIGGTSN